MSLGLALAAALAWMVLLFGRGFFWRAADDDRDAPALPDPASWPEVAIVIPARDEAETIGATIRGLLAQDYPGRFSITLVDDRSRDGTGEIARAAAAGDARLTVVTGTARPAGWTGKLWALQQGLDQVATAAPGATHLLFTDADIAHAPDSLRLLVARAAATGAVLVSLMARLRCASLAERALIPAFVFFFQMLYPFRWVNQRGSRTAGAAGGCVLLDRAALVRAGRLAPMRGAIIDDCTLAARMKREGPLWLGLTERVVSLRGYEGVGGIRRMVARTAYAQLRYNPAILVGMMLALTLVFMVPPALAIFAAGTPQAIGAATWAAMAAAYAPMLARYGLSPWWGAGLPLIAAAYMGFTLDSAWQEARGRGGMWKGEPGPGRIGA